MGALSGGVGVLAGAFGAHALKSRLAPELLASFETAARYQLFHALALLATALALDRRPHAALGRAAWCFLAGTVFFSGSLYALALTNMRALGAITPLGGLCLIAGWLSLGWGLWRAESA